MYTNIKITCLQLCVQKRACIQNSPVFHYCTSTTQNTCQLKSLLTLQLCVFPLLLAFQPFVSNALQAAKGGGKSGLISRCSSKGSKISSKAHKTSQSASVAYFVQWCSRTVVSSANVFHHGFKWLAISQIMEYIWCNQGTCWHHPMCFLGLPSSPPQ